MCPPHVKGKGPVANSKTDRPCGNSDTPAQNTLSHPAIFRAGRSFALGVLLRWAVIALGDLSKSQDTQKRQTPGYSPGACDCIR